MKGSGRGRIFSQSVLRKSRHDSKAQLLQKPVGLLKVIVCEETGKILGAMLFCEASHEMINLLKLAMDVEADYTILRDFIYTHPTMSEALNELLQS